MHRQREPPCQRVRRARAALEHERPQPTECARQQAAWNDLHPCLGCGGHAEHYQPAVNYLVERPEVDAARLGVVGHSMGGAAAIVAASNEPRIGAVVSSSAFADIVSLTRRTLRSFHVPRWPFLWLVGSIVERHLQSTMIDLSPHNRIGQIRAPVLLLHGADDERIPPSDMTALYANANHAKTWRVLLPDRGHEDIFEDPSYVRHIISFLHESLDPPGLARGTAAPHWPT